jgi:hypothetical protein
MGVVTVESPAPAPTETKDSSGVPAPLEVFVRRPAPNESHFYARGLAPADFAGIFPGEILGLDVLLFRIPPALLRPDLWEPLSKEAENAVREKMGGLIAWTEDEGTLLWRADRAEPGKLLKDGLEAPAELLQGYILRTTGDGLSALARAWNGRGRFEGVGLKGLPREITEDVLETIHSDLARMRVSIPEEAFLFASQDGGTRIVFTRGEPLTRSMGRMIHGYVSALARTPLAELSRGICGQLADLAEGRGLSSYPERDFIDKGRTLEVTLRSGRTPWSPEPRRGRSDKMLLYYDRTSGIWAVSP